MWNVETIYKNDQKFKIYTNGSKYFVFLYNTNLFSTDDFDHAKFFIWEKV